MRSRRRSRPARGSAKQRGAATAAARRRQARRPATAAAKASPAAAQAGGMSDQAVVKTPAFKEFRVSVVRPDDLLVLDIVFVNLQRSGPEPHTLIRRDVARPAYVILELPPQSFGEEAFLDALPAGYNADKPVDPTYKAYQLANAGKHAGGTPDPLGPLPISRIRIGEKSRLAFKMPADVAGLDFTLAAVLEACLNWPLSLPLTALPDDGGRLTFAAGSLKQWLAQMGQGAALNTLAAEMLDAVDASTAQWAHQRLATAAKQIGTQAAQALKGRPNAKLGKQLLQAMKAAVDQVAAAVPMAAAGQGRDYAMAALALLATREFARQAARVKPRFDLGEVIDYLPFLPLAPRAPDYNQTAIALPYRLLISPLPGACSKHACAFKTDDLTQRTELWHTRITESAQQDTGADAGAKFRAVWSPDCRPADYDMDTPTDQPEPFRMSLTMLDRFSLVQLMAGYNLRRGRQRYTPRAAQARRLVLSALGGLLDAEGAWDTRPDGISLEKWRHIATLGRDHFVRVVYAGYLLPFGHRASLVKVTERKFETAVGGGRIAVLRQRFFIVVREPVRQYAGAGDAHEGRGFPFAQVELLTRVTPNLVAPDTKTGWGSNKPSPDIYAAPHNVPRRAVFWPMIAVGHDFQFEIAATDGAGTRTSFSLPLLFVGTEANEKAAVMTPVLAAYNDKTKTPPAPRRQATIAGTAITYAPQSTVAGAKGDTRLPTKALYFRANDVTGLDRYTQPQWYPALLKAEVVIRPLQKLLGLDAAIPVQYPDIYLQHGYGSSPTTNSGQVFLEPDPAVDFTVGFGAQTKNDALGGLVTPGMGVKALSAVVGPAGDRDTVAENKFDPTAFFKDAEILGGVKLQDILKVIGTLAGADVPKLASREWPDRLETSYDWNTTITASDPLGLFVPTAGGATVFAVSSRLVAPFNGPVEATVSTHVSHFKVNLFGLIIVWFDEIRLESKNASKPDVIAAIHPGSEGIMFGGPLEFVNTLRELIPSSGFCDPPYLDISPSGLTAGYTLNLPSVQVGLFCLSNLSLGAGFSLPFDARPASVKFNFATRESPFNLTVSMFGGGGFFALGIGTKGVQEIEAAFEFGAGIAINLGVASGSVEVKAGVYFHWLETTTELTGYVRLHGELSILAIISASLTFNLQLSYLKEGGSSLVWGEATLVIEIEVLIFSASVEVSCRKDFAGSADPRFVQQIPDQSTWEQYCSAFAEEVA